MNENKIFCSECGAMLDNENTYTFDGHTMCGDCFNDSTVICENCGDRIWRENAQGDSNTVLCQHCYEYSYCSCEECGRLIHTEDAYYYDDDDYPYCSECFEKLKNKSIKNYGYKPEPIFYGSGNLFMGVELEIDKGGESCEAAREFLDIANIRNKHIYCKRDGSIFNGFEIVSHPMTLDYHVNSMNWRDIFAKALKMGYCSYNAENCGLHIHVNRSAFGKDKEDREEAIGRVVFFVEKHWNELVKFSRRTKKSLERWTAKYATISNTTEETYKKAKDKRLGRYTAVNLENSDTIEFRLFRGTLRYTTFITALQLVDEICRCAINMTDREFEAMSWNDFVSGIHDEELINYLKSKRLYVNEIL